MTVAHDPNGSSKSQPPRRPPGPREPLNHHEDVEAGGSLLTLLMNLYRRYGDVVRFRTRFNTYFLFNHPSHIREVLNRQHYIRSPLMKTILGDGLLASDGPYWERQRRLMLPEFQPSRMEGLVKVFATVARQQVATWSSAADDRGQLNFSREMERIALSNVGRALFGVELGDRFLDAFGCVLREVGAVGNAAVFGGGLIRSPAANSRFREAMQVVEETVATVMKSKGGDGPLWEKLLPALQSAGERAAEARLSTRQVRDEIVTMITAGHETTAVTLAWAWHAIATNPTVADRFYREVDDVVGGRLIAASDLENLRYTRQIIDETLRIYPPVWLVARMVVCDDCLGGYEIPAMSGVLISPYVVHRRAETWPDPERFDPERHDQCRPPRDAYAYLPFLAGRHLCIGKHFALTEIVVVLATIAQKYRIRLAEEHAVRFEPLISLRMRDPLTVVLEPRLRDRAQ